MKAIQTQYQGYRFRSRLEARWAVFFDALRVKWLYEHEGIETPLGRYLPDFWLPSLGLWVEVKAGAATELERQKASEVLLKTGKPVFLTCGLPDVPGEVHWSCTQRGGEWNWMRTPGWVDWNTSRAIGSALLVLRGANRFELDHDHEPVALQHAQTEGPDLHGPALEALRQAKGARFEFGESGGPGG